MNRWRQRLRGTRITLGQLGLVSMISAVVSALIVVGALAETGPEKAVIAALRARQVIREGAPGSGGAGSHTSTTPAAETTPAASAPASEASAASASDGSASASSSDAAAASDSSASDTSDSSGDSSSSGSSASSDSSSSSDSSGSSGDAANKPTGFAAKVKHVFVVVVSTPSFQAAFGRGSAATYLNGTLRLKGVLLSGYRTLGTEALPDYLAMVSGQAPNKDTEQDCTTYAEFPSKAAPAKDGLVPGAGCIYPNTAVTVGDQLDGANLHWRGYMDGMTSPCQHPNSGAADTTVSATGTLSGTTSTTSSTSTSTTSATTTSATTTTTASPTTTGATTTPGADSGYATRENPFVYFHSLLDLGDCQSDDLPLTKLSGALRSASSTPRYAFIAPDPCDDGTASTCPVGKPTGIAASDAFLRQVVPGILGSAAYRSGGALIIAFTTAPAGTSGAGGPVRTGALVISPHTRAGATVARAYDPYSVLRTVEDVFGLTSLARAKSAHGFDQAVFTR